MDDLRGCIEGDKRAWDAFIERYAGLIVAAVQRTMGVRRGGSGGGSGAGGGGSGTGGTLRQEVDDVVQDVFLRLLKDERRLLRSYDPARASLSTWLTLVARSVSIDRLRQRRPPPVSLSGLGAAAGPARDDPPPPEPVSLPLHLLSGRQRLVLRLIFDEGRSVPEAANFLGVDEQTVRSTKHKALTRLREHFAPGEMAPPAAGDARARRTV